MNHSRRHSITVAKIFTIAAAVPILLWAYASGPAARVTGAPGDQTCAQAGCHTGNLNTGTGRVAITFPSGMTYVPGQKQSWTVTVTHPGARVHGFQATARLASNETAGQAGTFTNVNNATTQILCDDDSVRTASCRAGATVEFIEHTSPSTTGTWTIEWTPPATDAGPVKIYIAGNGANGNGANTGDFIYTANYTLTATTGGGGGGTRPAINSGGVIDVWTAQPGVAPLTWTSIYGTNLSATTKPWDEAIQGSNLPTSLDGVTVLIDNKPATISYVSPTLINVLVPGDAGSGNVPLVVRNAAGESTPFTVLATQFKPTLYVYPQTAQNGRVYLTAVTGTATSPVYVGKTGTDPRVTRAARPGETLQVYGTGFGQTTPPVTSSGLFSGGPAVTNPVRIRFGQTMATVVNGNGNMVIVPGLYLFNVTVPDTLADGEYPLIAEIGGLSSSANVYIVVQR